MPVTRRSACEYLVCYRAASPQFVLAIFFGKFTDILISYIYYRRNFVDNVTYRYVISTSLAEIRSANVMVLSILNVIPITLGKKMPIII